MIFNPIKKLIGKTAIVSAIVLAFYSCGSGTNDTVKETTDSLASTPAPDTAKKQNIFYSIPSPIQLGQFLKRSGASYDVKVLNPLDNASKYSSTTKKALNLGVYGADLSYSAIFNQTQEIQSYLNGSKKLAEDLGISNSFSKETIKRMEKNIANKDSVLQIISEIFLNSNESLKDNDQSSISGLVVTGGFIEGLYVGTHVAKTVKKNEGIITRIAELKGSLNNLITILSLEKQDADIIDLINDLKSIKEVYDEMVVTESKAIAKVDTTKNTMTIGGSAHYSLSKEQLEKIASKAESIRAKIIKP